MRKISSNSISKYHNKLKKEGIFERYLQDNNPKIFLSNDFRYEGNTLTREGWELFYFAVYQAQYLYYELKNEFPEEEVRASFDKIIKKPLYFEIDKHSKIFPHNKFGTNIIGKQVALNKRITEDKSNNKLFIFKRGKIDSGKILLMPVKEIYIFEDVKKVRCEDTIEVVLSKHMLDYIIPPEAGHEESYGVIPLRDFLQSAKEEIEKNVFRFMTRFFPSKLIKETTLDIYPDDVRKTFCSPNKAKSQMDRDFSEIITSINNTTMYNASVTYDNAGSKYINNKEYCYHISFNLEDGANSQSYLEEAPSSESENLTDDMGNECNFEDIAIFPEEDCMTLSDLPPDKSSESFGIENLGPSDTVIADNTNDSKDSNTSTPALIENKEYFQPTLFEERKIPVNNRRRLFLEAIKVARPALMRGQVWNILRDGHLELFVNSKDKNSKKLSFLDSIQEALKEMKQNGDISFDKETDEEYWMSGAWQKDKKSISYLLEASHYFEDDLDKNDMSPIYINASKDYFPSQSSIQSGIDSLKKDLAKVQSSDKNIQKGNADTDDISFLNTIREKSVQELIELAETLYKENCCVVMNKKVWTQSYIEEIYNFCQILIISKSKDNSTIY